jgi:hypothetical protein
MTNPNSPELEISSSIASWALPKEPIPFNASWNKPFDFDRVEVLVPKDIEIVELLNVEEYTVNESGAVFHRVKSVPEAPIYFGGVVRTKRIPRKLTTARRVVIRFSLKSKTVREVTLQARVFRPRVELIDAPKSLVMSEKGGHEIPVRMKYRGFGDVTIKIQGIINGRRVTTGKSSVSRTTKKIIQMGMEWTKDESKRRGIKVKRAEESTKEATRQTLELLEKGMSKAEFLEIADDIKKLADNASYKQKLAEALNARIEDMIVGVISDLKSRNPTRNVSLTSPETEVEASLKASENLVIRIKYTDMMGNSYTPVDIRLPIEIRGRKGKLVMGAIPIILKEWESDPLLNVEEMQIGNE